MPIYNHYQYTNEKVLGWKNIKWIMNSICLKLNIFIIALLTDQQKAIKILNPKNKINFLSTCYQRRITVIFVGT